jgi:hypothetical protein
MQRFTDQIFAHLRTITVGRIDKIDAKFGQPAQSTVERNRSGACVLCAWTNYEKDADMTQAETASTYQFVAEVCLVGMGLDVLGGVISLRCPRLIRCSKNVLSSSFGVSPLLQGVCVLLTPSGGRRRILLNWVDERRRRS